jgi:GH25 family lysozyme M1 (1,4-beta-N-acetylmuramidase)
MSSMHYPRSPTGRGRFRSVVALMSLMAGASTWSVGTANARPKEPIPHPERDYMGSTAPDRGDLSATWRQVQAALSGSQQRGIDVSHWQGSINWSSVRSGGIIWAYMKATEGTSYTDPRFDRNYRASYRAGLIRGAYHFALPNRSSGAAQARFFVRNGGSWSGDGQTLPPALDIEYNPYGRDCYGLSARHMRRWIRGFSNTVKNRSGRYPVIYTTLDWWTRCTRNNGRFGNTNPLWIARWSSSPGTLPNGWAFWTFWQYTSSGSVTGISGDVDRDVFNGSLDRLRALAG